MVDASDTEMGILMMLVFASKGSLEESVVKNSHAKTVKHD